MLQAARTSISKTKNSIVAFACINCFGYIILVLACKYLNLLHITGLRMLNFIILTFVCFYQVKHFIKKHKAYLPFLEVYARALFTGALSFLLFAVFIFFYTWFDPYLDELYLTVNGTNRLIPALLIFFEGTGGSIIVAFIVMKYANLFADEEKKV